MFSLYTINQFLVSSWNDYAQIVMVWPGELQVGARNVVNGVCTPEGIYWNTSTFLWLKPLQIDWGTEEKQEKNEKMPCSQGFRDFTCLVSWGIKTWFQQWFKRLHLKKISGIQEHFVLVYDPSTKDKKPNT